MRLGHLLRLNQFEESLIAKNGWERMPSRKRAAAAGALVIEAVAIAALGLWLGPSDAAWRVIVLLAAACFSVFACGLAIAPRKALRAGFMFPRLMFGSVLLVGLARLAFWLLVGK